MRKDERLKEIRQEIRDDLQHHRKTSHEGIHTCEGCGHLILQADKVEVYSLNARTFDGNFTYTQYYGRSCAPPYTYVRIDQHGEKKYFKEGRTEVTEAGEAVNAD